MARRDRSSSTSDGEARSGAAKELGFQAAQFEESKVSHRRKRQSSSVDRTGERGGKFVLGMESKLNVYAKSRFSRRTRKRRKRKIELIR